MKFRVIATVALFCACTAVSAKKYTPPTPIAAQLPVEVMFSQQEIAIDTPDNSALANQGLIPALIGAAISNEQAKTAERRAGEVRNLLLDYRFNERFEAAIRAKIAAEGITPSPQIVVRDTPWDTYSANTQAGLQNAAAAGNKPPTGVLLSIAPRYALSYTLQQMYVRMTATLVDRSLKANGKYKDKWLFQRNYTFSFPLDSVPGMKPETNIGRWNAIGGIVLQRKIEFGVQQVTDMMVYDFSAAGRAEGALKVTKQDNRRFKDNVVFGRQLRTGDDWYWVRNGKGPFVAINGVQRLQQGVADVTGDRQQGSPATKLIEATPAPAAGLAPDAPEVAPAAVGAQ